jgi:DNA-binding response OmpR family regulator
MASIVIIEDEALLSRQFVRALEGSAHEAQAADTGESGLKLVREVHPDLVILDLRLPDRYGLAPRARHGSGPAERSLIRQALARTGRNRTRAAALLGLCPGIDFS